MKALNWIIFLALLIHLPPNIYYQSWYNSLACFAIGFALRGQIPLLLIKKKEYSNSPLEQMRDNLRKSANRKFK